MLGTLGEFLILASFVACAVSAFAFFRSARREGTANAVLWKRIGRWGWGASSLFVAAASGILWYLLLNHHYEYAYVYQQSSNDLPLHYLISTFWAGQEGSLLLWILMMCGVGGALIGYVQKEYETSVMAVVGLCQFFLLSMVVGLHIGPLEIGASPFLTLAEKFKDAPLFQQNPNFIPADGQGLNDLLQNPWMTIHPPMLFIGFSAMVVPFAFAIAALWKERYTQWVRPALPWTIGAVMVLGVGIAMGGYWAYVTLSFGGYWAWDPVENSSLVPWLLGVAAFHTMLVQKKSGASQKASIFLSIIAYIFVIYSTFLTRSGILGDVSVHSFVDLGLYNQLLIWIVAIGVIGLGMFAYRYNDLPSPKDEPRVLSREFMIFSGAVLLCATSAVVILGTSAPILGRIFRDSPSAVPIEFYNEWTLPLALGFVFLAGLGQLFWWNKMTVASMNEVLIRPVALATVCTVAVLALTPFAMETVVIPASQTGGTVPSEAGILGGIQEFWSTYGYALQMLLLVFVGFFSLFGNGTVFWRIARGNPKMAGGALSHIGFAILILGIVASSGFSSPLPQIGHVQTEDETKQPRENFVLAKDQTRTINGYRVTYNGQTENARGRGIYHLQFTDPKGRSYDMNPVAYEGSGGQWFMHPDVKAFVEKDIFVSVTPRAATGAADDTKGGEIELAKGDSTVLGEEEFAVAFSHFEVLRAPDGMPMSSRTMNVPTEASDRVPDGAQIAVGAVLKVTKLATGDTRQLMPIYMVMDDNSQQYIENRVDDWDVRIAFTKMSVGSGKATFAIDGVDVMPKDWVVVQAYAKPMISLVWIGIIILTVGFCISITRRVRDIVDAR